MKSNPVVWFEVYVDDMSRAKKFYETVFKTELQQLPAGPEIEMWAFPMDMNAPGAAGSLAKMEGFGPKTGGTLVYFSSEDCSIEESRIESAGGKIQRPKTSIGEYGFMTLAVDSEGNMFGIHSMK